MVLAVMIDLWIDAASRHGSAPFAGCRYPRRPGLLPELEVVDGALAATALRRCGEPGAQAADVALRPLVKGVSYVVFYGWLLFGIFVTADFGPSLLQPGRIEHLLSLPVRRAELLLGTYLGVLGIASAFAFYATGGVVLILYVKAGLFLPRLVAASGLAVVVFMAIYSAMLCAALFVRSAALSALVGAGLFILGLIAGERSHLLPMFSAGFSRSAFDLIIRFFPPISRFGDLGADYAVASGIDAPYLAVHLLGVLLFAVASLGIGLVRFEGRDF
jgi:Cu-processing system permease protein